jgi:hypothetical protein
VLPYHPVVTQEQDGQDAEWHPSHEPPATVDPSILPQSSGGASASFGGPEGYYSYPYPYPLPPPGESGAQTGEPGAFPPHFFPPGYPPYPHWQPPFGHGGMMGGPDDTHANPDETSAGGASNATAAGGSARTSGKKKRVGGAAGTSAKKGSTHSDTAKNSTSKRGSTANTARTSRTAKRGKADKSLEDSSLMDISSVTDPNLLGDELSALDPQVANA